MSRYPNFGCKYHIMKAMSRHNHSCRTLNHSSTMQILDPRLNSFKKMNTDKSDIEYLSSPYDFAR